MATLAICACAAMSVAHARAQDQRPAQYPPQAEQYPPPSGQYPQQGQYYPPPQPQGQYPDQGQYYPPQGQGQYYPPQNQNPQQGQYPPGGYPQDGQYPQQGYPPGQYPPGQYPPGSSPPPDRADVSAPQGAAPGTDSFAGSLRLGIGATARSVEFPSVNGARQLDTGLVPAVELHVGGREQSEHLFFGLTAGYQTSLTAQGHQQPPNPDGQALSTPIRTHRFEVGVNPGYRFGSSADSVTLGLFAGYGARGFASEVELRIPRYSLHGPVLRLELEVPISVVVVRVAPELQMIASVSKDLRNAGSVSNAGSAFGGEASLRVLVTDWAALQLAYRESHASSSTGLGASFKDMERFVFFDAVFRYE